MSVDLFPTTGSNPVATTIPSYLRQTDAQKLMADGLSQQPSTAPVVGDDDPLLPMAERIRSAGI